MAVETFEGLIGGSTYSYTQLPASKSLLLKLRLGKMLGASLPYIVESLGKDDKYQFSLFLRIIEKTMDSNEPEEVLQLVVDILSLCFVNKSKCNVDLQFTGKLKEMYEVVFWILQKEYGSFFDSLGVAVKSSKAKEENSSLETSTE